MSILVDKDTRVVVQGLGSAGKFHAAQCREYGTQVVAGVTPGEGGTEWEGIPFFDTVEEAGRADRRELLAHLRAGRVLRRRDPWRPRRGRRADRRASPRASPRSTWSA